jgi:S1-C subfamily serine protease
VALTRRLQSRQLAALLAGAAIAAVAAPGAPALSARGQDSRAAGRAIVTQWQAAIVTVRVVLKTRMSMGGREMQAADDAVDAVGTVIDPSGLTVLSLGTLNPAAMMNRIMGSNGGSGDDRVEITSEPSDLKIRLADGRELPATIVLRDEDLDLAFIRPTAPPPSPLVAIDLGDSARPALLDELLVLTRLGRVGGWAPSATLTEVSAIIERPRTFFVLGAQSGATGTPAFSTAGKIVGLVTIRQVDVGRSSMFSMMGGTEAMGILPVVLPAADVLEIARQAPQRDK